jgi:acyl carrier protein
MTTETIFSELQEVCVKLLRLPPDKIVPEARLVEDLDIDSLFAAELAVALERKFKIEIPEDAFLSLRTMADLTEYLYQKLRSPSP